MTILTIGLSCYDQFFFINQYPKQNNKEYATDLIESGGGPCGNASFLLGKWEEDVYHITTLKKDDLTTKKIINELETSGVKCNYALIDNHQITPISSILINKENALRTIITYKNNHIKQISESYKKKLDLFIEKLNQSKKEIIVLIDGHEFELSDYILSKLKNKKVIIDAGNYKESIIKLAKYVNYFVSSENFALSIIKSEDKNLKKEEYLLALKEIKKISHKNNIPVITLGDRGTIYLENNKVKEIPAYQCIPVDTTGAGDIYHGAFTYGVAYQWDIERIIKFSSLTSAMMIEKKGVRKSIPNFIDVEYNYLNNIYSLHETQEK